jgi:hypothetical protein
MGQLMLTVYCAGSKSITNKCLLPHSPRAAGSLSLGEDFLCHGPEHVQFSRHDETLEPYFPEDRFRNGNKRKFAACYFR